MVLSWRRLAKTITISSFILPKAVFGILVVTVMAQILQPSNRPMPLGRVNGQITLIPTEKFLLESYDQSINSKFTIQVNESMFEFKLSDLGVGVDRSRSVEQLYPPPYPSRFVPFWSITRALRANNTVVSLQSKSLKFALSGIAEEVSVEATDAKILYSNNDLAIVDSVSGKRFDPNKQLMTVLDAINNGKDSIKLTTDPIEPDITTDELNEALSAYTSTLPEEIKISIGEHTETLPSQTVLSWLDYESWNSKPVIVLNEKAIADYSETIASKFLGSSATTPTIVSYIDGLEVSRIVGVSGQGIDSSTLSRQILESLTNAQGSVAITAVNVPSPTDSIRTYSKTNKGLEQMLVDLTKDKNVSLKFVDLSSRGWTVGINEDRQSYMASTYKMFVAYSVLKRIDSGDMALSDYVAGHTVNQCLEKIIVDSNNECSISLAENISWQVIQNEGRALGANGLDWRETLNGTANDASVIPIKLAKGEILSQSSRDYLIDLMRRQQFRSGIPSGTNHQVANKVGFFDGWLNDAGIIYADDKTYVLSIYTDNESWELIAEITRQIELLVE